MTQPNYQVCHPVNEKHRIALQWFGSITNIVSYHNYAVNQSMLNRATEFYTLYASTADDRHLKLSEDFLQDSLKVEVKRV